MRGEPRASRRARGRSSARRGPSSRRGAGRSGLAAAALLAALLAGAAPRPADADDRRRGAPDEELAADPSAELAAGDRPWQRGVSEAQRATAERELAAGNELFERSEHAAAAARYRAALAAWAHPAIQFNLAVCLIYLDRPVEAYDLVRASLRFGREALPDHFDEAHNYERLLRDRIATLEVVLPPGAVVTLDGARLEPAATPARSPTPTPAGAGATASGGVVVVRRLEPGRHSLVARKPRFETWSKDLMLPPGEVTRQVIELREPRTHSVRRWSAATPWWVAGSGGAALAVGAASLLLGNANLRAVTAEVTQQCPPPAGCPSGLPAALASDRDRAQLQQGLGAALLIAGGVAVTTGVVLLVLNQPRQVLEAPGVALRVTPRELGVGWTRAF